MGSSQGRPRVWAENCWSGFKTDEIVNTIAFILSDEAGMMTGTIIDFDQTVRGAGNPPLPTERLEG